MPNDALYVYGIVKAGNSHGWKEVGINGAEVYTISEAGFSAIAHNCEEKPYLSKEPEEIKELIIAHNSILDKAMEHFGGVVPLSFNTIIKKGDTNARYNLKAWLNNDSELLEAIWDKIRGKTEYGIRIYYEKEKLIGDAPQQEEVEKTKKGKGLSYLLASKAKAKANELAQNKIHEFRQMFFDRIKGLTDDIKVNVSRISIKEDKDLLLNLSVLIKPERIGEVKQTLEKMEDRGFSFQFAGAFAPYSFVENGAE